MLTDLSWTNIILLCCGIFVPLYAMGLFNFGKNHFPVEGKTILLTGASDGMGRAVAQILAQKGANLMIVARNVKKLEHTVDELKSFAAKSTQRISYLSADLTNPDEAARIISETKTWNNNSEPDIVWSLQGGSHPDLFLNVDSKTLRQQMDLNYFSQADLAHAILREWLSPTSIASAEEEGRTRHFIFTATSLAFYPIAGYSPYSPAKAAIRSLSDTLTQEVKLYTAKSVKIHTVFPGSINSPGYTNEQKIKPEITKLLEKDDPVQEPEVVASKSIKGLERGEYLIVVNFLAAAMRGCAWGGSRRNNWVVDTLMTWVTSLAWPFIGADLDGKVVRYGRKHGHPSGYSKTRA